MTGTRTTSRTPDSQSDTEGNVFKTPRKTSYRSTLTPGGSRPSSQPTSRAGSRPGSKAPSRHGSNLSLDSTGTNFKINWNWKISKFWHNDLINFVLFKIVILYLFLKICLNFK